MANKEWIRRIVDTKGRMCPLLKKKCPGTENGCAFWIIETIESGSERDILGGCLYTWEYVTSQGIQLELVRLQAGMDKTANEARNVAVGMAKAIELQGLVSQRSQRAIDIGD